MIKLRSGIFGFTLIQNLVIAAVTAVAGIVLLLYIDPSTLVKKARDEKKKSDLKTMQKIAERYHDDFGKYPPNPGLCSEDANNCKLVRLDTTTADWGESFKPYAQRLPKDPSKKNTYIYYTSYDRQIYYLYANLDMGDKDKESCNQGQPCVSLGFRGLDPNLCGGICNYAVSSRNVTP